MPDDLGFAVPEASCPRCGHKFNRLGSLEHPDEAPDPGSTVVCIGCAGVLVVDEGRRVRIPTAKEVADIANGDGWPELQRTIASVRRMHAVTRGMRQ